MTQETTEIPLATYQESAGGRKVTYKLFLDTILCIGKNPLGTEFETSIKLGDLRSEYSTTRQYGIYFFYSLVLGGILFFVGATDTEFVMGPHLQFLALGILGIGVALFGRKISFVHFANHHSQILLSIAKKRLDQKKFESFLVKLQEQIKGNQVDPPLTS